MRITSRIGIVAVLVLSFSLILSCDRRGSVNTRTRDVPDFSVDFTAVIDYSTGNRIVEVYFERDHVDFSSAVITVGEEQIPSAGGGLYFVESPTFALSGGITEISFQSPEDDYEKSVTITIPDSFAITTVNPWYNFNADDVYLEWSESDGATSYLVAVATDNYYSDGTVPMTAIVSSGSTFFTVPDTTFEDFAGDVVPAVYYIYLIAYNRGFGPYSGIQFPVPEGLPRQFISDPSGYLQYGTVAPLDSIVVPRLVAD
jgi:hypothetical protein